MLTSFVSMSLESDSCRFGNPYRSIPVGECSSTENENSSQLSRILPIWHKHLSGIKKVWTLDFDYVAHHVNIFGFSATRDAR